MLAFMTIVFVKNKDIDEDSIKTYYRRKIKVCFGFEKKPKKHEFITEIELVWGYSQHRRMWMLRKLRDANIMFETKLVYARSCE